MCSVSVSISACKSVVFVCSETTTKEVIKALLSKFMIRDNPRKFALYERREDEGDNTGNAVFVGSAETD